MVIIFAFDFICLLVAGLLHKTAMYYTIDPVSLSLDMTRYEFEMWCADSSARQALALNYDKGFVAVLFVMLMVNVYYFRRKKP